MCCVNHIIFYIYRFGAVIYLIFVQNCLLCFRQRTLVIKSCCLLQSIIGEDFAPKGWAAIRYSFEGPLIFLPGHHKQPKYSLNKRGAQNGALKGTLKGFIPKLSCTVKHYTQLIYFLVMVHNMIRNIPYSIFLVTWLKNLHNFFQSYPTWMHNNTYKSLFFRLSSLLTA